MRLILFMVMSMDGIVAFDEQTDIRKYSSQEDHAFFIREATDCDAAIMGRFSYNREVSCKRKYLLSHVPADLDVDADTIPLSGDVRKIYETIEADGNEKTALLGGPRTNASFLRAELVDEIYLTVEPVLLGEGVHFATGELRGSWMLERSIWLNEKGTVVLHYVRDAEPVPYKLNRWQGILHNRQFIDIMDKLAVTEENRIFCRHDLTHLLDTARIMQIMNLEEGLNIPKDLIYAAGLLHDIGRLREYEDGTPHERAAVPIAESILKELGYEKEELNTVLQVISAHRGSTATNNGQAGELAKLLYRADKLGRLCFRCDAREECNWPEERKNADILL